MRRLLGLVFVLTCFAVGTPPAQASPIGMSYSMNISLIAGSDTLGLDGATMILSVLFDDADTYDFVGNPDIVATSDSLTISGASVGATNGSYVSTNGARFLPTFDGQFYGDVGSPSALLTYSIGGLFLQGGRLISAVGGVNYGDLINASHFGTTPSAFISNPPDCNWCVDDDGNISQTVTDSRYSISNLSTTAVPEPTTWLLFGTGLVAAGARRYRQRMK